MGKKKHQPDLLDFNNPTSPFANVMFAIDRPHIYPGKNIPEKMLLDIEDSGLYLGLETEYGKGYYVGKRSEQDGNALITGINGSGKSYICAKSMIETWRDPFVALDFKGELSCHYMSLKRRGRAEREYIIFDPTYGGAHYDPFALLHQDKIHFEQNVREIAYALIPMLPSNPNEYWIKMAQNLLSGIIVYCFSIDLDFIETMLIAVNYPVSVLCKKIMESNFKMAKAYISEITGLKKEHQAMIGTDMKQHLMVFATDPCIQNALSNSENEESFSWEDIIATDNSPNVFLRLDQDRLEQWADMLRLILTQLIRTSERRPDKQTPQGRNTKPLLILLDEFPLLGKIDVITNALTTLRSKKITFCLMIQSIAQLDAVYGHDIRKIIVDNCQYKVILNITEPDSQEYFSRLIGSVPIARQGMSQSYDSYSHHTTYGRQIQEFREPLILPHEFATNRDMWLHTPFGFLSTVKLPVSETHLHVYEHEKILQMYMEERK